MWDSVVAERSLEVWLKEELDARGCVNRQFKIVQKQVKEVNVVGKLATSTRCS